MSTPRTDLFELRMKLKGKERRWTEKFFIGFLTDVSPGLTAGLYLCQARRLCIAKDFQIYDAALHNLGNERDRYPVPGGPGGPMNLDTEAGPPIAFGECNSVTTCLNVEYGTANGKFNTRQFRALRDAWVTGDALTFTPTIPTIPITPVPGTDLVAGLTKEVALGTMIAYIAYFDKLKREDPAAVVRSYDTFAWTRATVKGISHRDTGVGQGQRGRRVA